MLMQFERRRLACTTAAGLILLATGSVVSAQAQPDPASCYVMDEQFARQFDWLVIGFTALAALIAPILVVYLGLARRAWWAAHPVGRWCVISFALLFTFLALWVALPVLALLGFISPDLGLRFHFG